MLDTGFLSVFQGRIRLRFSAFLPAKFLILIDDGIAAIQHEKIDEGAGSLSAVPPPDFLAIRIGIAIK